MAEEFQPKANPHVRSLQEAGYLNGYEGLPALPDHAQDRLLGCKWIAGDTWFRIGDPAQQRRLPGVGDSNEPHVRYEAEL